MIERLHNILNIIQDPILEIVDEYIDYSFNKILWQNDLAIKEIGNFIDRPITDVIDIYTWKIIYEKLKNNKTTNYKPLFIKNKIYHAFFTYIETEEKEINNTIGILLRDITQIYLSEIELKKINKQYRYILDAMDDIVIIYNPYTYEITFANQSASQYLGYDKKELLGKNFYNIILCSEEDIEKPVLFSMKENKKIAERKVYIKKNNELLPVHIVATKINFIGKDNNSEEHILIVARDISKEIAIEEALKNTNQNLKILYSFITDLSKVHTEDESYAILTDYLKKLEIDYIHIYKIDPISNQIISSSLFQSNSSNQFQNDKQIWIQDCLQNDLFLCKIAKLVNLDNQSIDIDNSCPLINIDFSIKSYICIPIFLEKIHTTNPIAILTLMSIKENFFDEKIKEKINKFIEAFIPVLNNIKLIEINKELSIKDPLTNAYNRRFLDEMLKKEIQKASRQESKLSIIMIDVDNFKQFNDTYGHRAGDMALQHISNIIQENIRTTDIFARYGGEELMIVLPNTPKHSAVEIADRIKNMLSTTYFCINQFVYENNNSNKIKENIEQKIITASFGIATFNDDATNLEELIKIADERLYKAKKLGKNRVIYK